ncbi:MAG: TonB-dependent receptor [Bermanella sp.]
MAIDLIKVPLFLLVLLATSFVYAETQNNELADDAFVDMFDSSLNDDAFQDMFDESSLDIPVVLTASRLRQSQLDAPASVTVIEADTIAALGFKDIEEIFRLVPGMLVGYHSGFGEKQPTVSYHGTQAAENRRMQVLVDGRSIYKPGLARVEWVDIPLAIEDIARIEVIRGPNAATYGANSYLGVINIMSKHPNETSGTVVKVRGGGRGVSDSYINIANQLGSTNVHWTLGSKNKDGFDYINKDEDENRDSSSSVYTQLRTHTQVTNNSSIEWQAGIKVGTNQQRQSLSEELIYIDEEDIDSEDVFIMSKYNYEYSPTQFSHLQVYSENFKRTQEWSACFKDLPTACGDLNKNLDETKSEIEYQHTSIWTEQVRSVAGFRLRLDEFESEAYNNGNSENRNASVFSNIEYKFFENFVANIGGMYEEDQLNGEYFSPRVALNYHVSPSQSIKLIYSEAIRSPNLFELSGRSSQSINNVTVNGEVLTEPLEITDEFTLTNPYVAIQGEADGQLTYEKIYSHELSYFGLMPELNAQLDIKFFYDELSGLISESLDLENALTNENKLVQHGVEGQAKFQLNSDNQLWLTWAYVESDDDFNGNNVDIEKEQRLSAKKSGSIVWISNLNRNTQLGAAYYHVDNWNDPQDGGYRFSRLDLNLARTLALNSGYQLKLQAATQYRLDDDPLLYSKNIYEDKLFAYVSAELNF